MKAKLFFNSSWARIAVAIFLCTFVVSPAYALVVTDINLASPLGGEQWSGTQAVTWSQSGFSSFDTVSILLSNGGSYNTLISGVSIMDLSYAWDTSSVADGTTYKIKVLNVSTGVEDASPSAFTVDNTAPVTTYAISPATPAGSGWYNISTGAPTVTLSCTDVTSGCNKINWGLDGATTPTEHAGGSTSFIVADGEQQIVWRATDNAGNVETMKGPNPVNVDTIAPAAPVITSIANDNYISASEAPTVHVVGTAEANATISVSLTDGVTPIGPVTGLADGSGHFNITIDASMLLDGMIAPSVTATDAAGNVSLTTSHPVVTKDTVAAISSITSDGTGAVLLKIGDTITFTLTPSTTEPGSIVFGTYNGQGLSWSTANGGVTYTATYTVTEGEGDRMLPLQITGVTYKDIAGNMSAPADGSDVTDTIDATRPVLLPVSIQSNNTNPSYAKSGDIVTLSFTSSESISTPTVTIDAQVASVVGGPMVWSATYTFVGGETEGVVPFSIAFADTAGNAGVPTVTVVTDTSSVTYDETAPAAPVITSIADDNYINASEAPTVHVVGTAEANATISVSLTDGVTPIGPVTGLADGSGHFNITIDASMLLDGMIAPSVSATDAAGNVSSNVLTPTAIKDVVAPTIASITTTDTAPDGTVDTATIVFNEPIFDASVVAGDFTIGGVVATGMNTGTANDNTIAIMNAGVAGTEAKDVLYIPGTLTDIAGNPLATVFSGTVTEIDAAKPVLLSAKTTDTTTVMATFSEDLNGATLNTSGTEFTVSGYAVSHASENLGVVTLTVALMPTGATPTVTYAEIDSLDDLNGNTAVTPVTVTAIDNIAPVLDPVSISSNNINDGAAYAIEGDVVTLQFTASEVIGTPTVTIQGVAATSITNPSGNDWVATRVMDSTDTEGIIGFTIDFADVAVPTPNTGAHVTTTTDTSALLFDRTNPAVDAGMDKEVNAASAQDATISDGGSGLLTWTWSYVSGPGTATFSPSTGTNPSVNPDTVISADTDGTYVLRLTVSDKAGNSDTDDMTFIWDTTNPEPLTSDPSNGAIGVAVSAATAIVTFDEPIVLTHSSRVLLVDDITGNSYQTTASVSGGNGTSAILNIGYTGLVNGTKYRINVKPNSLTDVAGNALATNFISYFTSEIDTTAPVVNALSAGSITANGATLSATTDEAANCSYRATDSAYASMTAFDTTGGTSHTVNLAALTMGTGYHYYVRCADVTAQTNTMTNSAQVSFTTLNVDTTKPVLTLLGQNPLTLTVGDTYVEAGATAADDVDGDVTSNIVINSSMINTAVAGTYVVTYDVTDAASNAAVQETRTVLVVDPAVTPVTPTVVIHGAAVLPAYTASEAATRFVSGLQFDTTNAASVTVNGSSVAIGPTVTAASLAEATTLGLHVYNVVVTSSTGHTANSTVSYMVNADFDDTATLAVTGVDAIQTYATADNTYANGWKWTYHITVPTSETAFKMKFSDFVSGANTILAANNIRFYTVQASAHADETHAVTITASNTYSSVVTLDSDAAATTPGRQIDVTVEMKVPLGSAGGSYSGSYGVQSN